MLSWALAALIEVEYHFIIFYIQSEDHLTTVVNTNAAVNEEDKDKATEEEKGKKKPIEGQPYTHAVASLSSDCLDLSDPGDFGIVPC